MVTRLRYYSFKEINMRGRIPFMVLAAIAFGIAVVLVQPATVLFLLFLLYSLSGVVTTLARKRRLRKG
ncbi:hypothetical protein BOV90_10715 [Solemya velum gill symbiont]|nr:hypothetical protein BOV90_10715 [Solemya velum gill symbiont]